VKKFLVRFTLIVGSLLLVALVVGIVEWQWTRAQGRKMLVAARAKLDAAEPGWQLDDLTAQRNASLPPAGNNVAEIALKAIGGLPREFDRWQTQQAANDLGNVKLSHRPDPTDLSELRQEFGGIHEMAERLSEIRKHPSGGLPLVFPEPNVFALNLNSTMKFREAASVLRWQAMLRIANGDPDAATDSVRSLLHLRLAISDEPTMISQLVRVAIVSIAAREAERLLSMAEPTQGLAELQAEFAKARGEPFMAKGLNGERAGIDRLMENMSNGKLGPAAAVGGGGRGGFMGVIESVGMSWMKRCLESNHAIMLDHLTAARDTLALRGQARKEALRQAMFVGPRNQDTFFVHLLMPAVEKVIEAETRNDAQLGTIEVAIACERHRRATGRWPATLAEIPKSILPEIPGDPYSDEPIKIRRTDTGLNIYSVGSDGRDDGGRKLGVRGEQGTDLGIELFDRQLRSRDPLPKEPDYAGRASRGVGIDLPYPDPEKKNPYVPPPLPEPVRPEGNP
jgi:hypothetical protein